MIIQKRCKVCGKVVAIQLHDDQYMMWRSGVPLRDITNLTPDDISLLDHDRCVNCEEDEE